MKIAIVYNRISDRVINLFGQPNREKYGIATIKRITDALRGNGHQVKSFEGDKDLIDRLEEFMPRVVEGERPGLVFNVSYGIQGQARYTHIPSILEMVGIPYVGSGPLAHSLALDKVVAKMIFVQNDLPTPEFCVLDGPDDEIPEMSYPAIVKPRNEAVSFGIKRVENADEVREAAAVIFEQFDQPVLVERFIEGREVNVGLLGNSPIEALPPVELGFGDGPSIYSYEDKVGRSGRQIQLECPAPIGDELTERAQALSKRAFRVLGCVDCARVDLRVDDDGQLWILEVNSLPSLGQRGSFVRGAAEIGLDFAALCNRLVEIASARYFGTPTPPQLAEKGGGAGDGVFQYLTERRDQLERRTKSWCRISSRSSDPVGLRLAAEELGGRLRSLGLSAVDDLTDDGVAWTYETKKGLDAGTLLLVQLDVPLSVDETAAVFRRDPEALHGEGIALSRAPLAMLEYALRALKSQRALAKLGVGVCAYADEGQDCARSERTIRRACERAGEVLVLRPGNPPNRLVRQRRGRRSYRLAVEGSPRQLGQGRGKPTAFAWFCEKVTALGELDSRKDRIAVSVADVKTRAFPTLLPHRIEAELQISYFDERKADETEARVREILGRSSYRWSLERTATRPAMAGGKVSASLLDALERVSEKWSIPLEDESSVWPSVAGLVPPETPVVCGIGPVGGGLYTSHESVQRIQLVQRTLLLSQFLLERSAKRG